jgi:hypothetical protein
MLHLCCGRGLQGGVAADRRRDDANIEMEAACDWRDDEGAVEEHASMWWVGVGDDAMRRRGCRRRSRWRRRQKGAVRMTDRAGEIFSSSERGFYVQAPWKEREEVRCPKV